MSPPHRLTRHACAVSGAAAQSCVDFAGTYDDQPHWTGGQMTQDGCSVQFSASWDSSCSGTVSGSTLQWSGSCGGNTATGTLSGDVISWSDGNSWERRPSTFDALDNYDCSDQHCYWISANQGWQWSVSLLPAPCLSVAAAAASGHT